MKLLVICEGCLGKPQKQKKANRRRGQKVENSKK
jgi:hypothetical protein